MNLPARLDPGMAYGIVCNYEDDGGFSFIIGERSQHSPQELEDGLVQFEIPEGKYAELLYTRNEMKWINWQ